MKQIGQPATPMSFSGAHEADQKYRLSYFYGGNGICNLHLPVKKTNNKLNGDMVEN
jgi:hypothetical protein